MYVACLFVSSVFNIVDVLIPHSFYQNFDCLFLNFVCFFPCLSMTSLQWTEFVHVNLSFYGGLILSSLKKKYSQN